MENILELQQVSKTFPKSNFTLENVTFSLPYGAIMGFVGENGAGKTTTIGCILNTIAKDRGTVITPFCYPPILQAIWKKWRITSLLSITANSL